MEPAGQVERLPAVLSRLGPEAEGGEHPAEGVAAGRVVVGYQDGPALGHGSGPERLHGR